jgi:hypothetical protein
MLRSSCSATAADRKEGVGDVRQDRTAPLAFGARRDPLGVGLERIPQAFALGEVLPCQEVGKLLVALAHERGPEADRADAVLLPELQGHGREALVEIRQLAGQAAVDAQFVDHGRELFANQ